MCVSFPSLAVSLGPLTSSLCVVSCVGARCGQPVVIVALTRATPKKKKTKTGLTGRSLEKSFAILTWAATAHGSNRFPFAVLCFALVCMKFVLTLQKFDMPRARLEEDKVEEEEVEFEMLEIRTKKTLNLLHCVQFV